MTEDSSAELDFSGALQRLGESDPNAAVAKAKEQLDGLDSVTLNIAVTGETGAGKSAFINAFRGLNDDDDDSAPTGITETTKVATMYTHPTKSNVRLWDLPGIGMPNFKANKFLKEVKFETYDLFIIISSVRFKENDVFLAKEIQKKQKRFYFVRSKIDNDIWSASKTRTFDEQQVLCTIREDCHRNVKELGNPKVFLISSYDLGKYDFQDLVDTLESDLSEYKRFALVQSLPVCSLAMLEKKKEVMEKFIWLAALGSSLGAVIPYPLLSLAIDKTVLMAYLVSCHNALGLNEQSLIKLSERMNKPLSQLKSAIKSPLALAVVDKMAIRPRTAVTKPVKRLEDLLDTRFLVNSFMNATEAFRSTQIVLHGALNDMINDMRQVLQAAGLDE
ncbi:interferon-gamma-inducible GTPase 10-like isoform X2 [Onychostoma macrolepis]|uniref:interferon-gamma-inducible GTPase 10-like isoform X2 n=1 Tax=Onychostoma macrolepis TaxID=369639 RepID=UPI00272B13A2|nr:interferon-gamma-inducible GTPase 10-like isoform X2 [Onychostoma macrolepis]XP_058602792.1 interferon-gamma-inducible GTPase 10-like isoform X2 [Onychostoma macrolepis]